MILRQGNRQPQSNYGVEGTAVLNVECLGVIITLIGGRGYVLKYNNVI